MNRFLRMSLCVAVVLLAGTVLTLAAFLVPLLIHGWLSRDSVTPPRWIPVPITLLAWFGIQGAALLGERLARRLGLEPRGMPAAPGLLRSTLALGAGVVAGGVVVATPILTLSGGSLPVAAGFAMGASGTVGFLWARAILRGGLFAPPPADPPA